MNLILILEKKNEGFFTHIQDRLLADGVGDTRLYPYHGLRAEFAPRLFDLAVISPGADEDALRGPEIACRILLLPEWVSADTIRADCLVTYGMSPKSSVTLSSISEKFGVVAIMRELATVSGEILDRQELCVPRRDEPDFLLAGVGAVLLLDGQPENARIDPAQLSI